MKELYIWEGPSWDGKYLKTQMGRTYISTRKRKARVQGESCDIFDLRFAIFDCTDVMLDLMEVEELTG